MYVESYTDSVASPQSQCVHTELLSSLDVNLGGKKGVTGRFYSRKQALWYLPSILALGGRSV